MSFKDILPNWIWVMAFSYILLAILYGEYVTQVQSGHEAFTKCVEITKEPVQCGVGIGR